MITFTEKKWHHLLRYKVLIGAILIALSIAIYFILRPVNNNEIDLNNRENIKGYVDKNLEEALKYDKGTGCDIPRLDPFAPEVIKFDKKPPKIVCEGHDWVRCYLSQCKVVPDILEKLKDIVCHYQDILFKTDFTQEFGDIRDVFGPDIYTLKDSDHVLINCRGREPNSSLNLSWTGYGTGLRPVTPKPAPPDREHTYNVLILGFDTTAKNGFIRKMPKSYKFLTEEVEAIILNGYNIVGDGTPAALFPILTGSTELELPDVRKVSNKNTLDSFPFIFYKLQEDGYRTAFFEDWPQIGTFQYRFNGWKKQPTDHGLRPLLMEKYLYQNRLLSADIEKLHCIGDTPVYKLMMNCTEQFMSLPGKKFVFNFIVDISHDDFNKIATADEDTVSFLRKFMNSGLKENTLLIVMGDHGPRFADVRSTLQGKLEERLPLMAIRLPDRLVVNRRDALTSLMHNAEVLTTPHDLHATILDVVDMRQFWNPYKIAGAELTRALTLLEPIPESRSCSEAGVEPHWCACLSWRNVSRDDPLTSRAANTLLHFINKQTEPMRSKCAVRELTSIDWVITHSIKEKVAKFIHAKDNDGYTPEFDSTAIFNDIVQVKITVGPDSGVFEASLTHHKSTGELAVNPREISRINAYGHEPDCVSATHPHLNPYCYCNKNLD